MSGREISSKEGNGRASELSNVLKGREEAKEETEEGEEKGEVNEGD